MQNIDWKALNVAFGVSGLGFALIAGGFAYDKYLKKQETPTTCLEETFDKSVSPKNLDRTNQDCPTQKALNKVKREYGIK